VTQLLSIVGKQEASRFRVAVAMTMYKFRERARLSHINSTPTH